MSGPTVDEPGLAVEPGWISVVESGDGKFTEHLLDGRHRLIADEPVAAGGKDRGPGPYELLLMALGACTTMTLRLYADRKRWPLERVSVRLRHAKIYAQDCADCETRDGYLDHITKNISLQGPLNAEQRLRLLEISELCPVQKTLKSEVHIETRFTPGD